MSSVSKKEKEQEDFNSVSVWVGCETSPRSIGHGNRVSDEIDRLRAESERAASSGDNIKIVIRMLSTNQSDHFAVDSLFQYVNKNVVVTKHPEVRARSGQTLVIGGGDSSGEDVAKALLGFSKRGVERRTLLTVTPYVK